MCMCVVVGTDRRDVRLQGVQWTTKCVVDGKPVAAASAIGKRNAEQAAAREALISLGFEVDGVPHGSGTWKFDAASAEAQMESL